MLTRLIRHLVRSEPLINGGAYQLFQGVTWQERRLPKLTYEDLGYKKHKEGQLRKHYINEEEIEHVERILNKRARQRFTSVGLSFRGEAKRGTSQGHCLLSMVVSRLKTPFQETVEIHYRSTEAIFKFSADLVLLRWVFARLGLNPERVTFRFTNIHLSGNYLPALFQYWEPADFIDFVHKNDMDFLKRGCRFLLRAAYKEDQFFPYSPHKVMHRLLWERGNPEEVVSLLEPLYLKYGWDLPKLFHTKESYQVRRKKGLDEEEVE